jgi:hypothetical protein
MVSERVLSFLSVHTRARSIPILQSQLAPELTPKQVTKNWLRRIWVRQAAKQTKYRKSVDAIKSRAFSLGISFEPLGRSAGTALSQP